MSNEIVGTFVPECISDGVGFGENWRETNRGKIVQAKVSQNIPDISDKPVPGVKDQKGKARFSLIPFRALREVTNVLNNGATVKYSPNNWRTVKDKAAYVDGIVRHWTAYFQEGEEKDPESGLSALAHLACNVLFLLDDRLDKKDVPFDEYVKDLLTYSDYVKGQITEPYAGSAAKKGFVKT